MFPGQNVTMKVRIGPYSAYALTSQYIPIEFDIGGGSPMSFDAAIAAGAGVAGALEVIRKARHPELGVDDMLPDVGFAFEPAEEEVEVTGLEDFDPAAESAAIQAEGETVSTETEPTPTEAADIIDPFDSPTDFNGDGVEL